MACSIVPLAYLDCPCDLPYPYRFRKDQMVKALSVRQPFATFIANKDKWIETRSKPTKYRGPVLICASKRIHEGMALVRMNHFLGSAPSQEIVSDKPEDYPLGHALCMAQLVDCRPMVKTDEEGALCKFYSDRWSWVLANPYKVKPFDVTGQLGFFNVSASLIKYW